MSNSPEIQGGRLLLSFVVKEAYLRPGGKPGRKGLCFNSAVIVPLQNLRRNHEFKTGLMTASAAHRDATMSAATDPETGGLTR